MSVAACGCWPPDCDLVLGGMSLSRSSLGRRDVVLLAAFVALWLVCWSLSAASILRGSRYPR